MFIVLIINVIVIFWAMFEPDKDKVATLDMIDEVILYFYVGECVIKIIGLGVEKYFEDEWNVFDFWLAVISLFSSVMFEVLSILRSVKTAKTAKILRLTRINRLFKMFRAVRSVKLVNFLMVGADAFN